MLKIGKELHITTLLLLLFDLFDFSLLHPFNDFEFFSLLEPFLIFLTILDEFFHVLLNIFINSLQLAQLSLLTLSLLLLKMFYKPLSTFLCLEIVSNLDSALVMGQRGLLWRSLRLNFGKGFDLSIDLA
jgi:hypothetical protein